MRYALYLEGKPTPKGRAAPKIIQGKVRMFTPAATRHFEKRLGDAWTAAEYPLFEGPVALRMIVSPQGMWIEVWEVEAVEPERGSLRSDLDNHIKTVDGLNGIAWHDDKAVIHITADKIGKA